MLVLSIAKIVGAATKKRWAQVHTFIPSREKLLNYGALLLVLRLEALDLEEESEVDLASFGKEVIQRFHERYYGTDMGSGSVLEHLSHTAEAIADEFKEVDVEAIAGVTLPVDRPDALAVLYLVSSGSGSCVLLRGERPFRVLVGRDSPESGEERKAVTASGFVQKRDMLLLGSGDFFRIVSPEAIKKALGYLDPDEASSILAPQVHGHEENSGVAAVVVKLGVDSSEEKKDVAEKELPVTATSRMEDALELKTSLSKFRALGFIGTFKLLKDRLGLGRRAIGFGPALGEGEIIVRTGEDRRRRLMLSVALTLLVLLLASVFFGWRRRIDEERARRFAQVWEVVEHQYNEALSLLELNPRRARALLNEAKDQIGEGLAAGEDFSAANKRKLSELGEEIEGLLEEVSGEYWIEEGPVFLDLTLIGKDTYADSLALHGDTLVVLDKARGALMGVSVEHKSADAVGGGALLRGARLASVYAGRGFVLSDSGLVEVSLSGKTSAVVMEPDPEWGEIIGIGTFAGNLYLLDRGTGEVFRYQSGEGGFGARRRWFGTGVFPDLSDAKDMAIDGDIWILKSKTILKFRSGAPEAFSISGLDRGFNDPVSLYTDAESLRLYILDRGNLRVVVLDKSGEYREQYLWSGIAGVSDMVVSEAEGKILLVSGSVIYEIELKGQK